MKKKRSISRKITAMLSGMMLVTMGRNMAFDFFSLRTMNRTWRESSGVIWLTDRSGFVPAGMKGMEYRQSEVTLEPGDVLFQYSAGVTEAGDETGNLYGEERLKILLNHVNATEPRKILAAVWKDIQRFQGGAEQFDDITMLSLRYNGGKKRKYILEGAADYSRMPEIYEFAEDSLQKENISEKNRISILITAEELFTNILKYSGAESAHIVIEITEENVALILEDDGMPFNPLKAKKPDITLQVDKRPAGGLGICMVKKLMVHAVYEYSGGKNCLTMYKNLNFPEAFHIA